MKKRTTLLSILDGFGLNPNPTGNAVVQANPENFKRIFSNFPSTTLITHGERVGLPDGQMGNSEVGHLNIGAGRVVYQWLTRISKDLKEGMLALSPAYHTFIDNTRKAKTVHLIGLFSDGGVHSHIEHLYLLLDKLLHDYEGKICIHLITDGRDTGPRQGITYIERLVKLIKDLPRCFIGSISGRYYAMDRDKRWERTEKAVKAIALGEAPQCKDLINYINNSYESGVTDEFIEPAVVSPCKFEINDCLLFWNFREDRMRQIVKALSTEDFSEFERAFPILTDKQVLCFTEYDHSYHLPYLFSPIEINNHLGEVISKNGLKQLRLAETEKYAHVTYFFNGGIEKEYPGEERKLVPSPRDVKTYDQKPEMSALPLTDVAIEAILSGNYDLIVLNFANCDMVGHTGILDAAVKAAKTVDQCLGRILEALEKVGGQAIITADHGNAEQMINYADGTPHTAHTLFPVPLIVWGRGNKFKLRDGGTLSDIAPTILEMMEVEKPAEMTGKSLICLS